MLTEKSGRRPERPPFWVAFGFISAFAATMLTVVLTGLYVRAPGSEADGAGSEITPTEATAARPRETAGSAESAAHETRMGTGSAASTTGTDSEAESLAPAADASGGRAR